MQNGQKSAGRPIGAGTNLKNARRAAFHPPLFPASPHAALRRSSQSPSPSFLRSLPPHPRRPPYLRRISAAREPEKENLGLGAGPISQSTDVVVTEHTGSYVLCGGRRHVASSVFGASSELPCSMFLTKRGSHLLGLACAS